MQRRLINLPPLPLKTPRSKVNCISTPNLSSFVGPIELLCTRWYHGKTTLPISCKTFIHKLIELMNPNDQPHRYRVGAMNGFGVWIEARHSRCYCQTLEQTSSLGRSSMSEWLLCDRSRLGFIDFPDLACWRRWARCCANFIICLTVWWCEILSFLMLSGLTVFFLWMFGIWMAMFCFQAIRSL